MRILIVYGSQFGTTADLAGAMGDALAGDDAVRVLHARDATSIPGSDVDLLVVGAPTQMHGLRLLVRPFLAGLAERGYRDVAAAAFDTRGEGTPDKTGSAADGIAARLVKAGCRLVRPPEGFVVSDLKGPLADGEQDRAIDWIRDVAAAATPVEVVPA
jgi:flavodoxin